MSLSPRTGIVARGRRRRGGGGGGGGQNASIVYSLTPDRASPTDLDAATVPNTGSIYPHLNLQTGVSSTKWYLGANAATDAANAVETGTWVRNDATVPYDLKGGTTLANPLDLSTVAVGSNVCACRVTPTVGSPYVLTATFTRSGSGTNNPGRIEHGVGRLSVATLTFGPEINWSGGGVPKVWQSGNINRGAKTKAVSTVASFCASAAAAGYANVVLTITLAWSGRTANADPSGTLVALQATANGDNNTLYRDIAQAYVDNGYPNGVVRLAHEHNLPAFPHYSGNGRAATWVAAWNQAAASMRAVAPNIVLDWNIGTEGADPTGGSGGLPRGLDEASYPTGTYEPDCLGLDIYARSTGLNPVTVQQALDDHANRAASKGKPVSYPEVGISLLWYPNGAPPGSHAKTTGIGTDAYGAIFIAGNGTTLPDGVLGYANQQDMAYFGWWNANNIDQGYKYRIDATSGRTQEYTEKDSAGNVIYSETVTHSANPLSYAAIKSFYD